MYRRNIVASLSSLAILLCLIPCVRAQIGASTGAIVGTVSDKTGAIVAGADVQLTSQETALSRQTKTTESGQFTLPSLPPGDYRITVTNRGFKRTVITVRVEVGKSSVADLALDVGDVGDTVQVTSEARAGLQTLDSQVGEVLSGSQIIRLPTVQRQASELVYLQVATTPVSSTGATFGGSVAGARPDQNSATLDGIIITDFIGGGNVGGNISRIPLPIEAVEEFRGVVSNPNESLSRSSGGHFAFATRSGSNAWHGAGYAYHQNDNLNANAWSLNRRQQKKTELKDNRFGFRIGGPIWHDKTFFFLFYEGRRFPRSADASRIGISEQFRSGVLRFPDASGATVSYNLNPANGPLAATCGPAGNQPCDPRGIGMSPLIKKYFDFYPKANDPSVGDGLNAIGIADPVDISSLSDTAILRLDHNLTSKWRLHGSYFYQRERTNGVTQVAFNPTLTEGKLLVGTDQTPGNPDLLTAGLTGFITPSLTYEFAFGYSKQQLDFLRNLATPLVDGQGLVIDLASALLDDPDDVVVGRMRPILTQTKTWQFNNNLTWTKFDHVITGGVNYQIIRSRHARYDRTVLHSIPIARITANEFRTVPAAQRPRTCSATVTTGCLRSTDVARWDTLYSSLLGIWDNTQGFYPRDSDGNYTGARPVAHEDKWHHVAITGGDTWRFSPTLTLSYGVNVTYETPMKEVNGLDYSIVDARTGVLIDPLEMLRLKQEAARQGRAFNQQIAYVFNKDHGLDKYPPIFNAGPRLAAAWNPAFRSGLPGKLFGDKKSVLRGGYSLLYDQILTNQAQVGYMNGNQLIGDSFSINAPTCERQGTPGPGCTPGVTPFRLGVDGVPTIPAPGALKTPLIPGERNPLVTSSSFGVSGGRGLDPNFGPGHVHSVNLTFQRELPGNFVFETGWIGRWGRNLSGSVDVNAPPVVDLKDLVGGSSQTFAQAFDALAGELRAGVAPTGVAIQPWFENLFGPGGTRALAARASTNLITGKISRLFSTEVDRRLAQLGLPTIQNQQYDSFTWHMNGQISNYNAFFASVRQNPWRGLSFVVNWTWSNCLDTGGRNEANLGGFATNPYDLKFDYSSCYFDRRHMLHVYGTYDLPAAKNNKLLSGWYTSYIFSAWTGLPLPVSQGGDAFGVSTLSSNEGTPFVVIPPERTASVNVGIAGSGGVGTTANPAQGGTGLNIFENPEAAFRSVRPFLLSQDGRVQRSVFRGLGYWNLDLSLGKTTTFKDRLKVNLSLDFFNIFNHVNYITPALSIFTPASFGVITADNSANPLTGDINQGPRRLQVGLRIEF